LQKRSSPEQKDRAGAGHASPDQSAQVETRSGMDAGLGGPQGRPVRASWLVFGAAAAVILTLISVWFTGQWYDARERNRLLVAIAEQVADQYLDPRPLEIQSDNPEAVLGYFDPYEDALAGLLRPDGDAGTLLGGRVASLQSVPAAELRFANRDGRISSQFAVALSADQIRLMAGSGPEQPAAEIYVRGLRINIWTEQGLLFAEARAVP